MNVSMKKAAPVLILALGFLAAVSAYVSRPQAAPEVRETPAPLIRVIAARPQTVQLTVGAQGTVQPSTQIELVAEVAGRVVETGGALVAGGFFSEGDLLVRIDPRDYDLAAQSARAEVARAQVALQREKAEAEVAGREWRSLHGKREAPPLVVRAPQLAETEAALAAAQAGLEKALLDVERTEILAPFDGRVREETTDLGAFVSRGVVLAKLYAIDKAEVRLPLPDSELAFLDLPLGFAAATEAGVHPAVRLSADFAGERRTWNGRIVRTEGELDPRTRMVHVVAEVPDPYRRYAPGDAPLSVGMFVRAEILGRTLHGVYVLPRETLRNGNEVLVVEDGERLSFRTVGIIRRESERVIVGTGLVPGERICVSPLEVAVDGMRIRVHTGEEGGERASR